MTLVAATDRIFCATPYSLFSIDPVNNNIDRLSKISGLNEVGVSTIAFNEQSNKLIIAYNNSNIDILYKNEIINIDAIKRKEISGDKSIYRIFCFKDRAYLSTGIGIIVLDETKYEVKDTYIVGNNGLPVKISGVVTDGSYLYAATEEGLKRAVINDINLADYRNWQLLSGAFGLPAGACQQAVLVQNKVIVQKDDSLFVLNGPVWNLLYTSDWLITNTSSSSGKLVCTQRNTRGESRILILNPDGSVNRIIQQPGFIVSPREALWFQNETWIADMSTGLIKHSTTGFQRYQPDSPVSISTGELVVQNNSLWVTAGTVTSSWDNTFNRSGFSRFTGNQWINYNSRNLAGVNDLYDLVSIAVDPADHTVWAGSFGAGLLQFKADNSIRIFKEQSPVQPSLSIPDQYRVGGLALDNDKNLWIANYGAFQGLSVRKSDGTSRSFQLPFSYTDYALSQVVVDSYNQKWIVSPKGNGLFCFNHGSSIDNSGDDRWKYIRAGKGNGNLPDNNVLSIAKDKNGFIWVGTSKGIAIIQCPQQIFDVQGCEAVLPVVQQDNFAGYLFSNESVQCIAVDGANRKWIGTKNGVWLISSNGDKTVYRFKEDNSLLLGDDVKKITVDPSTGEVYFATTRGLCSFRGNATEGTTTNENALVFPNPVPPGYNGTIAIRGLANNALFKITELDGRLVYQSRANGGQATWHGRNYKGQQVASGVYLVIVSDDTRREKLVTKIVMVR
ncbi:MAG: two-component regulator propeller domain-containing protein [Chitinophagaceae bacterium]